MFDTMNDFWNQPKTSQNSSENTSHTGLENEQQYENNSSTNEPAAENAAPGTRNAQDNAALHEPTQQIPMFTNGQNTQNAQSQSAQYEHNPFLHAAEQFPASNVATTQPNTPSRTGLIALVAIIALVCGLVGGALGKNINEDGSAKNPLSGQIPSSQSKTPEINGSASAPTELFAQVAARVQPSVVSIKVDASSFTESGSGVVLTKDGYILTNNHVVADAASRGSAQITVKFQDGTPVKAHVVGRDPSSDIAIIQAEGVNNKTPAQFSTSETLHVGDSVLAIGSPLGLEGTVTSGIVSSLHRTVDLGSGTSISRAVLPDAIQTDAAINPGNSGGALVNTKGEVVGINTAIASLGSSSDQGGNIGLGFAIPIETAKDIADQLLAGKTPQRGFLGVSLEDTPDGVAITQVRAGGPADAAGVKADDIVTSIDNTRIESATALSARIRARKPGDKITLAIRRNGQDVTLTVTLAAPPAL